MSSPSSTQWSPGAFPQRGGKAFSAEWALVSGSVTVYPIGFQLDTMRYVLTSNMFLRSFVNSVIVTVLGTALSMVVTGWRLSAL